MLGWLATVAHAGVAGGAMAGAAVSEPNSGWPSGPEVGVYAGWRAKVAIFRFQPEVVFHSNVMSTTYLVAAPGAEFSLGGLVGPGVYAHLAWPLAGGIPRLGGDAGVLLEVRPLPFLHVGLRAGIEQASPLKRDCADCTQPPDQWFDALVDAGLHF